MKIRKRIRGFTFIELMVSMSIIGILAAIGLTSYQGARKSARDGRRKADMESIRSALEMYRADNGSYPGTGWQNSLSETFLDELIPTYMSEVPIDPLNTSSAQCYYYQNAAAWGYRLFYNPETIPDGQDPDPNDCYGNTWKCYQAP